MNIETFYKYQKESKKGDNLTKRKYIRTQCKLCKCVIEYDARVNKKHTGKCRSCNNKTREGHVLTDKDIIYESGGRRSKGVKVKCKNCGIERIIRPSDAKKQSEYCKSCARSAEVKPRSIEQIRKYIKENVIIDENGCWIWQKIKDRDGYGRATVNAIQWWLHRLSYSVFEGPIPDKTLVRHSCHAPSCCNPFHLTLGNNKENMLDMRKAGRQAKGEQNGSSKLTKEEVVKIRKMKQNGIKSIEIAKKYRMNVSTINRIILGKFWKHVTI